MYKPKEIPIQQVQVGLKYEIHGDLYPCGHDTVVRKITQINERIRCECGRVFIINNNLHIYEWNGR